MAPAFICCTGSRVTAPAVFSSLNAKGRDSLHGVDVPDRVRVCTRRGTRHVTRARHSRVSLPNCPWKQSFEKKNLGLNASSLRWRDESCIRECKQRVHAEVGVYRISQVCKPPAPSHHRSPTLTQAVRGSRLTPAAASRCSKICPVDRPRQHVRKHLRDRIPRVGKLPAPSRHRSPALTQAVRGSRLTPAAASRCSKICPVHRPRQHACKHRCDRIPKVRQTARAVTPSLSHTLADCARQPAHSRRRFAMVENRSHRAPTPTCMQASV